MLRHSAAFIRLQHLLQGGRQLSSLLVFSLNFKFYFRICSQGCAQLATSRSSQPLQPRNSPQVLGFRLHHWDGHLPFLHHRNDCPRIEFHGLFAAVLGSSTFVNPFLDFITGERRESHCDNDRLRHGQSVTDSDSQSQ